MYESDLVVDSRVVDYNNITLNLRLNWNLAVICGIFTSLMQTTINQRYKKYMKSPKSSYEEEKCTTIIAFEEHMFDWHTSILHKLNLCFNCHLQYVLKFSVKYMVKRLLLDRKT